MKAERRLMEEKGLREREKADGDYLMEGKGKG